MLLRRVLRRRLVRISVGTEALRRVLGNLKNKEKKIRVWQGPWGWVA